MRTLDKKLNGVSKGPYVSGHVSGVTEYLNADTGAGTNQFSIGAVIGAAYETIGPTGSGATNIWTGLDIVPTGAKWVELRGASNANGSVSGTYYYSDIRARITGSSTTAPFSSVRIGYSDLVNSTGASETSTEIYNAKIPVDSNNTFEAYYSFNGSATAYFYLIGFGI